MGVAENWDVGSVGKGESRVRPKFLASATRSLFSLMGGLGGTALEVENQHLETFSLWLDITINVYI